MDTRYLISNSKDQTIKLWDMRRFADETTVKKSVERSNAMNRVWDYRIGAQPLTRTFINIFYFLTFLDCIFDQCNEVEFLVILVYKPIEVML